jgi:hypothetical protein
MFGLLYNAFLIIYPLEQSILQIKKPRLAVTLHWMIWWNLFSMFLFLESIGFSWMPFWYTIKACILIPNYNSYVSSYSMDMIKMIAKRISKNTYFKFYLPYWYQTKKVISQSCSDIYYYGVNKIFGIQDNVGYIDNCDTDDDDSNQSGKIKLKNQS